MPTVIDPPRAACGVTPPGGQHLRPGEAGSAVFLEGGISRRHLLVMAAGAVLWPAARAARSDATLLAAWQQQDEQRIGLLGVGDATWSVQRSLAVPTRAHGLWAEAGGSVLAVARRPGDWLLRWHPASGRTQWHWVGEDRRFNGHVIARDGATLWTTETDLDTAMGRIGVRDAASLEKTGEWATHGMDPHQLLALPQAVGDLPAGTLVVANGGIPTLPETGRSKRELGRMDASLVALHPGSGALLGQWRLADPFLSLRHLAFDPVSGTLGIALQAEHPKAADKAGAAVLAVWDGRTLRAAEGQPPVAGYGGDICAWPGGGFAVSCPRTHQLALYDARGVWQRALAHREACALTSRDGRWWLGGASGVLGAQGEARATMAPLQFDNHWVPVA
jgi:hypothetical protein